VLHTDDVPVLEEQMGKKLAIVSNLQEVRRSAITTDRLHPESLEQKRPPSRGCSPG